MNQLLESFGIIPVIKINQIEDAVPLSRAVLNGGLGILEITFRTEAAAESIAMIRKELPNIVVGAGTILTLEQAKKALSCGASFLVSPGFNREIVSFCVSQDIPIFPGCATASDIEAAMALGLGTVKFFPAEAGGGIKMIKALSGPYGKLSFMPTGGISLENMNEYLAQPNVIAVGGSWMVNEKWIEEKNFAAIEEASRAAVDAMLGFSLGLDAVCAIASGKPITLRTHSISRAQKYLALRNIDCAAAKITLTQY